jgi:hypothetical protein
MQFENPPLALRGNPSTTVAKAVAEAIADVMNLRRSGVLMLASTLLDSIAISRNTFPIPCPIVRL